MGCWTGSTRTWRTITDDTRQPRANAAEVFARKRGTSRDLSHIFIGAAHSLGIPARYVAGYFRSEGVGRRRRRPRLGRGLRARSRLDGFDPANGFCPTDAHVRVAIGLDSLGAAPVRGMRYGAGAEKLGSRHQGRPISRHLPPMPRAQWMLYKHRAGSTEQ